MKKEKKYKYIALSIAAVAVLIIVPTHMAHGAGTGAVATLLGLADITGGAVLSIISFFTDITWRTVGFLLQLTGGLLNISINLSMNIKEYVANTAGVYVVWQSIRDLSGMLIIFLLLYTSFRYILGLDEGINKLVKNIIIAGILINFSFFLTGLMIDASNMVSLSIYNAITPQKESACDSKTTGYVSCLAGVMTGTKSYDGGLSAILIQSLKVTDILNTRNAGLTDGANDKTTTGLKILFMQVAGIIIMVTTGMSFVIASIAFIVRLVLLIFILAFSPIWFASWIFPGMSDLSNKFTKNLKNQLILMPAYLIMLYAALKIVDSMSGVLGNVASTGSNSMQGAIVMVVNYVFVAVMINVPLMAAVSLGGVSDKWLEKFGAENVWGKVGKATGSFLGRNSLGVAANRLQESGAMKRLATFSPNAAILANRNLKKVSSAGFGGKKGGYDAAVSAQKKDEEAMYKQIDRVDKTKYDRTTIEGEAAYKAAKAKAKKQQAAYLEALPSRSIFNLMLKSRASRQSAQKITETEKTKENRKHEARIRENLKDAIEEQKKLNKLPEALLSKEEIERKAKLEEIIKGYEGALEDIEDYNEERLADEIAKRSKSSGGDGGGSGGGKPKKDSGGAKP